jgi:hypothetical protein
MSTEVVFIRKFCTRLTKCASPDLLTFSVGLTIRRKRYEEKRFDRDLLTMKFVLPLAVLLCGGVAAQREGCAYLEVRYQKDT